MITNVRTDAFSNRSARALLDELDFPEQLKETEYSRPKDKQAQLRLHFHIVLPATEDAAVYNLIFESIKRHFC